MTKQFRVFRTSTELSRPRCKQQRLWHGGNSNKNKRNVSRSPKCIAFMGHCCSR